MKFKEVKFNRIQCLPTVCDSIVVTRNIKDIESLNGCKYVQGNLTLSWLKDTAEHSIRDYSFPELVEIRDFLKIHHVDNVLSIGDLFPNLTVIQGQQLNGGTHVLQVASCPRLETLGLSKLQYIGGGNIQIVDNKNLCLSDKINWKAIAPNATMHIEASSFPQQTDNDSQQNFFRV